MRTLATDLDPVPSTMPIAVTNIASRGSPTCREGGDQLMAAVLATSG